MEENTNKKPIQLPTENTIDYAFENMIKQFIHQIKKDGIIEEVKARRYYIKPSMKKRLAKKGHRHGQKNRYI